MTIVKFVVIQFVFIDVYDLDFGFILIHLQGGSRFRFFRLAKLTYRTTDSVIHNFFYFSGSIMLSFSIYISISIDTPGLFIFVIVPYDFGRRVSDDFVVIDLIQTY